MTGLKILALNDGAGLCGLPTYSIYYTASASFFIQTAIAFHILKNLHSRNAKRDQVVVLITYFNVAGYDLVATAAAPNRAKYVADMSGAYKIGRKRNGRNRAAVHRWLIGYGSASSGIDQTSQNASMDNAA